MRWPFLVLFITYFYPVSFSLDLKDLSIYLFICNVGPLVIISFILWMSEMLQFLKDIVVGNRILVRLYVSFSILKILFIGHFICIASNTKIAIILIIILIRYLLSSICCFSYFSLFLWFWANTSNIYLYNKMNLGSI